MGLILWDLEWSQLRDERPSRDTRTEPPHETPNVSEEPAGERIPEQPDLLFVEPVRLDGQCFLGSLGRQLALK